MAALVKTKTWSIVENVAAVVSHADTLLKVYNQFKSFGWTITLSSNGVTAGAGDNISTTADLPLGNDAGSNARGWFVAQNPRGRQLLIDRRGVDTSQFYAAMSSTGAFTGGTTTAAPTAIDSFPATPSKRLLGGDASFLNTKLQFFQSSDGANTMIVHCRNSRIEHFWCFGDVLDPHPAFTSPCAWLMLGLSGDFDAMTKLNARSAGDETRFTGFGPSGSVELAVEVEMYHSNSSGIPEPINYVNGPLAGKNDLSGLGHVYERFTLVGRSDYPGRLGQWPDVYPTIMPTTGYANGDKITAAGGWVRCNDLILPWGLSAEMELTA